MTTLLASPRDFYPVRGPVIAALSRKAATHGALVLYFRLLLDAELDRRPTFAEQGKALGITERQVKRLMRVLKRLGLVRNAGTHHYPITHTADRAQGQILKLLMSGELEIDVQQGTVGKAGFLVDLSAGPLAVAYIGTTKSLWGTSKSLSVPLSDKRDLVVPVATHELAAVNATGVAVCSVCQATEVGEGDLVVPISEKHRVYRVVNTQGVEVRDTALNAADTARDEKTPVRVVKEKGPYDPAKLPLKTDGLPKASFDPERDPYRAQVVEVQAYADAVFGRKAPTKLVNVLGQPTDAYKQLLRALAVFGFTVEECKQAIDGVLVDSWWAERGIRETATIFRKEPNVRRLLTPHRSNTVDRRFPAAAALPKGVVGFSEEI